MLSPFLGPAIVTSLSSSPNSNQILLAERNRNPTPSDLLRRINVFVRSLVEDLANGRSPSVALDRFRNYCSDPSGNCNCHSDLPWGKEMILLEKESHAYRLDVLFRVLLIIQQLLQQNKHGSKRDIYYMHPSVFLEQAVVDRAINDICNLLKCSRHNLNVVPVGKGLVMGWLKFVEAGREIYCFRNPNTSQVGIEERVFKIYSLGYNFIFVGIVSVAQYIIVVEKEAVFQRLANDRFCDKNHCIVITGRGYPDVPTRWFLHHLVGQLKVPTFCLVDSDPYGFDILTTYRFGSMQLAHDTKLMSVPEIRWLGVFPSEFERYHLPDRCLVHLTPKDKKKVQAMLSRCYLHQEAPQWRLELEIMLQKGVKFEIEALSVSSLSFLSEEYIPAKIQHGEHI